MIDNKKVSVKNLREKGIIERVDAGRHRGRDSMKNVNFPFDGLTDINKLNNLFQNMLESSDERGEQRK